MPRNHRQRKPCRLAGHDYAQPGFYFVTLVSQARECLFGEVIEGEIALGSLGEIVRAAWEEVPRHFPPVQLDTLVVMPNHLHGIVVIPFVGATLVGATHASPADAPAIIASPAVGPATQASPSVGGQHTRATHASPLRVTGPGRGSLGAIVGAFKSASARRINEWRGTPGMAVWQRGYFDHIIRHPDALDRIRRYIRDNPARWPIDRENAR